MTQVQGPPPGTTVVDEPPATSGSGRGRRRDPAPKVKLGPGRWFREVGWRHLVGVIAVLWALFPVSYLVSASLNPLGNVVTSTMIPQAFSLTNYTTLLDEQPFGTWYRNSIIVCVCVVFIQLLFSALAAFAFSRFRFTGRRGGLLALLLIQMFPQFLAAVALYLMFTDIGEVIPSIGLDTLPGYILMMCGGSLGQVWLIKGFFDSIPMSLDEAAMLDGASHVQVFFRIILPLVRPILAVCGLLVFVGVIGEFDQERAEAAVRELLIAVGENPDREGLKRTPHRVANAYREMFAGLYTEPDEVLATVFDEGYDELRGQTGGEGAHRAVTRRSPAVRSAVTAM